MSNDAAASAPPPAPGLNLPPGFLWGASTSSYQIEGAAGEDGRGPSIWDTHCRMPGRIRRGESGAVACDHYHRYAEDIGLMRDLGLKAYRFSIAWPRVLPRGRGAANGKGLDFYDRLVDALLEAGIQPWICLYHWDFPQALQDLGGWTSRDSASWFADYALLVGRRYGDRVKHWASFNEQSVSTLLGFAFNRFPPGLADRAAYFRAVHHQNLAHGAAIDVLRDIVAGASLGIVHSRSIVYPERHDPAHQPAVALMDTHWNGLFPDPQILGAYPERVAEEIEPYLRAGDLARIRRPLDWFGLNHYSPLWARRDPDSVLGFSMGEAPEAMPRSEIGWAISPDVFRQELLAIHERYGLPVYVTENGFGSDKDSPDESGQIHDLRRIAYLHDYTLALAEALHAGADIRGYFVWSLLDNFEWLEGYDYRFGLVYVDFASQARMPKASARWYASLIRANA